MSMTSGCNTTLIFSLSRQSRWVGSDHFGCYWQTPPYFQVRTSKLWIAAKVFHFEKSYWLSDRIVHYSAKIKPSVVSYQMIPLWFSKIANINYPRFITCILFDWTAIRSAKKVCGFNNIHGICFFSDMGQSSPSYRVGNYIHIQSHKLKMTSISSEHDPSGGPERWASSFTATGSCNDFPFNGSGD